MAGGGLPESVVGKPSMLLAWADSCRKSCSCCFSSTVSTLRLGCHCVISSRSLQDRRACHEAPFMRAMRAAPAV